MFKFLVGLVSAMWMVSCAQWGPVDRDVKSLEAAMALRGYGIQHIREILGEPADSGGLPKRAFWFLSYEKEGHPYPVPRLFEFQFKENGELENIRPSEAKRGR